MTSRDIDDSSENVLSEWPSEAEDGELATTDDDGAQAWGTASATAAGEGGVSDPVAAAEPEPALQPEPDEVPFEPEAPLDDGAPIHVELSHEHAAGDLHIPDGYAVLEGEAEGGRRAVGIVVSRFNGKVTTQLLDRALEELAAAGVRQETITIMVVPGAFELPLAATALAKTRRFACIVALGCIIRGDTPHFDYVASEAASGLQLAALETGVPVSFGVLTLDRVEQAEPRIEKGAEAVRSALEMADLFSQLRAAASR
ncbi:MAG TPA: 6,7-dimethyl-8-ribityllumazine synthase [Gaiellaceae bacterium]|nr:6,7-dimethyl-8-ribityllumazine synthase [Gaiellaceae bacterium]